MFFLHWITTKMDPASIMEFGLSLQEHAIESYEAWKYWAMRRKDCSSLNLFTFWTAFLKSTPNKQPKTLLQRIDII